MKRKLKNEKAITLIALVITIVVLIILATVAINLSLGENGLFKKAKLASQEYKNATQYEETEIAKYANEVNEYAALTRAGTTAASYNYSLNEQIVGTWIDGKPIYEKTIVSTVDTSKWGSKETHRVTLGKLPSDFDEIIDVKGHYRITKGTRDDNIFSMIPLKDSSTFRSNYSEYKPYSKMEIFIMNSGDIDLYVDNNDGTYGTYISEQKYYVTIQYTKTTDQAKTN